MTEEKLPMDGERYLPWMPIEWGKIHNDHLNRYYFARQIAEGKIILDIASGEGYGSNILAEVAKKVVGVDISEDAVEFAKQKYKKGNLEYLHGDACNIPIEGNGLFDVICSFETLEHLDWDSQLLMLSEFTRLIKSDGILIISTPNRYYTQDIVKYDNPHHKLELEFNDFDALLARSFLKRKFYSQQNYESNQIIKMEDIDGLYKEVVYSFKDGIFLKTCPNEKIPQNYICVASNAATETNMNDSFLTDISNATEQGLRDTIANSANINSELFRNLTDTQAENINLNNSIIDLKNLLENANVKENVLNEKNEELLQQLGNMQIKNAELSQQLGNVQIKNAELSQQIQHQQAQVSNLEKVIQEYENSTSWRVTKPIRNFKRLISKGN
ncbi:MAG: class I SAM-dependent methyltransferase [Defluviitaleaceae bacterium]|nr:class I SAM-dependent methyltransferase [Defluviitaleaceae bacterium]